MFMTTFWLSRTQNQIVEIGLWVPRLGLLSTVGIIIHGGHRFLFGGQAFQFSRCEVKVDDVDHFLFTCGFQKEEQKCSRFLCLQTWHSLTVCITTVELHVNQVLYTLLTWLGTAALAHRCWPNLSISGPGTGACRTLNFLRTIFQFLLLFPNCFMISGSMPLLDPLELTLWHVLGWAWSQREFSSPVVCQTESHAHPIGTIVLK